MESPKSDRKGELFSRKLSFSQLKLGFGSMIPEKNGRH